MATTTATMTANSSSQQSPSSDPLSPSRWTAPQELALLQSLVRWKPVGLHKHFRMLAIHEAMLSSGTIPSPISDHSHASTIAGIWRKLESLYDLKALDEREDSIITNETMDDNDDNDRKGSKQAIDEYWREFELKGQDLEGEMWERRLASDGEDEGWSDDEVGKRETQPRHRESTVADSEDLRSSPPVDVDAGSVRGTRMSGRRSAVGKRIAEVKQNESGSGRGGSRRTSKAVSPSVDEDVEMQDNNDDGSEENDEEEEVEESEQEESDEGRRNSKSSRARGGRRGRGRRGRRGK